MRKLFKLIAITVVSATLISTLVSCDALFDEDGRFVGFENLSFFAMSSREDVADDSNIKLELGQSLVTFRDVTREDMEREATGTIALDDVTFNDFDVISITPENLPKNKEGGQLYYAASSDFALQNEAFDAFNEMMESYYNEAEESNINIYVIKAYDISSENMGHFKNALSVQLNAVTVDMETGVLEDRGSIYGNEYCEWIYDNAYKYGFISASKLEGEENILRYIGKRHSEYINDKRKSNSEYSLEDYVSDIKKATFEQRLYINSQSFISDDTIIVDKIYPLYDSNIGSSNSASDKYYATESNNVSAVIPQADSYYASVESVQTDKDYISIESVEIDRDYASVESVELNEDYASIDSSYINNGDISIGDSYSYSYTSSSKVSVYYMSKYSSVFKLPNTNACTYTVTKTYDGGYIVTCIELSSALYYYIGNDGNMAIATQN